MIATKIPGTESAALRKPFVIRSNRPPIHAENNAIVVPKVRLIATITRAAAKLTLAPHRIPEKISLPSESVPMMWLKDGATFASSTFVALGERSEERRVGRECRARGRRGET